MMIRAVDRPVTSPTVEPITLALTKLHLRQTTTSEDTLIRAWIAAARAHFEEQSGRQCVNATWEYALDGVPVSSVIELPRPPLVSVESVLYDDGDGVEQTLDPASYRVHASFVTPTGSPVGAAVIDPYCACGRLELVSGASWPTTSGLSRSLRIRRVCGYGATPDAMPELIQATLYLLVGHFYSHREEVTDQTLQVLPFGVQALLSAFKWTALPTWPPTDGLTSDLLSDWCRT